MTSHPNEVDKLSSSWEILSFDTNILGVKTARLIASLPGSRLQIIIEECAAVDIELLYWTPESGSSAATYIKYAPGYAVAQMIELNRVLDGEGKTVSCPASFKFFDSSMDIEYFKARVDELTQLALIAGKHSRFRLDPAFTKIQFKRMYSAWVNNSISGEAADRIIAIQCKNSEPFMTQEVIRPNGKGGDIAGFITIKLVSGTSMACIGLLAVSPSYQRRGLGLALISAAESWVKSQGVRILSVKTQVANREAVSFYSSLGFTPLGPPKMEYHIWLTHKVLPRIRYNVPCLTGDEISEISRMITANAIDSLGPYTQACEKWLKEKLECSKVLLTLSATAALEQAVILCGVGPGDEVIIPSYTFVSTANAVALRGAVPVFVDITGNGDLNLDPEAVRRSLTGRTKAIIVVHYGGKACNMDSIMEIAEEFHLTVIEDAAQAFLSTYNCKYLGTIGHLGCFSFHYTKNIVCGEGGALLLNDPKFHSQAVMVREKGTNRTDFMMGRKCKYEWLCLGSSYVPSELCAAFLLPQLNEAEEVTRRRRLICAAYTDLIAPLAERGLLSIPNLIGANTDCVDGAGCGQMQGNGHLFALLFPSAAQRQAAQSAMAKLNIQCLTHFVPLHLSEGGKRYGRISGSLDNTTTAAGCLLRLPVWPGMHFSHVHRVVQGLFDHLGQEAPSIRSVIDMFLANTHK